uniref:Uncharacterized protein n=1 Tax=Equus asinus TaxID=9793 RepID=A0A9L0K7W8_EQUAS
VISSSQGRTLSPTGFKGLAQGHPACKELGFELRPANSTAHAVIHDTLHPQFHPEPVKQGICRVNKGHCSLRVRVSPCRTWVGKSSSRSGNQVTPSQFRSASP